MVAAPPIFRRPVRIQRFKVCASPNVVTMSDSSEQQRASIKGIRRVHYQARRRFPFISPMRVTHGYRIQTASFVLWISLYVHVLGAPLQKSVIAFCT